MHMVKRGKRDYLNNLKSASSKDFWKAVKNLNGSQCTIPTLNHSGETATSDNEKATMLNNSSQVVSITLYLPLALVMVLKDPTQ